MPPERPGPPLILLTFSWPPGPAVVPPSSAFPRLALRPESRRSCWPGVGGPRAGHLASPFSACVGARGGRDRRVGPAFPYLPLEPRPPFLCPSSAGGRGLTREGELMGGGSWRPDLRGTGRSWRPFSFRGGREDRTWAWSPPSRARSWVSWHGGGGGFSPSLGTMAGTLQAL